MCSDVFQVREAAGSRTSRVEGWASTARTSPLKLMTCENRMLASPMLAPASTTTVGRSFGRNGPKYVAKRKCSLQKNCRANIFSSCAHAAYQLSYSFPHSCTPNGDSPLHTESALELKLPSCLEIRKKDTTWPCVHKAVHTPCLTCILNFKPLTARSRAFCSSFIHAYYLCTITLQVAHAGST
jgi:hypothetical protein